MLGVGSMGLGRGERGKYNRKQMNRGRKKGCYIATAVYGSYDCPQVWILRRYRDNVLSRLWYGRLFILIYYMLSPMLIKLFGEEIWFTNFFHSRLEYIINKLKEQGIDNTLYIDK